MPLGQGYSTIALAGRRTDVAGSHPPRFPLNNTARVRDELTKLFLDTKARALVSSAACGADLTALQVAVELGMECHIVLPFKRPKFKRVSVADRPGDWSSLFDKLLDCLPQGAVTVLQKPGSSDVDAFEAANREIVELARSLAMSSAPLAVAVWEGASRGTGDATASFVKLARDSGMRVVSVPTC